MPTAQGGQSVCFLRGGKRLGGSVKRALLRIALQQQSKVQLGRFSPCSAKIVYLHGAGVALGFQPSCEVCACWHL